jgi:AcrR family transcriptional regulator
MAPRARRAERRTDALSRERIIEAAVELLDQAGEGGLTFRALTERLATGPGAIYWHVAGKGELLAAATDAVVATALAEPAATAQPAEPAEAAKSAESARVPSSPRDEIRAVALGLYDAIDAHPWLAAQLTTQLARSPSESVTPRILESIGRPVRALGVPEGGWFTATFALVHYILGAAGQNAANEGGAFLAPGVDRDQYLDAVASAWEQLDPSDYPFMRALARQLRGHDDQAEFLAGVDLVLAGITAVHPLTR